MTHKNFHIQYSKELNNFIDQALEEDLGNGDHTSLACLDNSLKSSAVLLVKEAGIIAGIELAAKIFKRVNADIEFVKHIEDGENVQVGDLAFTIKGPQYDLLATERLVLNCMQRMSGIASLTDRLSKMIRHTNCVLLDTRKTTPNFRYPEKWAVQIGGGKNHRMGLFDMIMIKDNHIDFNGSLRTALEKTQSYLEEKQLKINVIVEVRNLKEIETCLSYPWIHRLLLDNMPPKEIKEAIRSIDGKFKTEASGNITEKNLVAIAETGVDFASLGALTHSARNMDLSLKSRQKL